MHFLNVDVHFALGALGNVLLELVDFRALAADDDAGTSGVNAHDELVRRALDIDGADAGGLELFFQLFAELDVFVQQIGVIAIGIPARFPRLVVAEAETVGMCFLTHIIFRAVLTGPTTSSPFFQVLVYPSKLCEHGARFRERPCWIPVRQR